MMKEQKGITLVALVITIIVLLILAGVSIAALSGQNGILTNASEAKQQDAIGAAKDIVSMAINESINAYYDATYAGGDDTKIVAGKPGDTAIKFVKAQASKANGTTITVNKDAAPATVTITTTDKNPATVTATIDADGALSAWSK